MVDAPPRRISTEHGLRAGAEKDRIAAQMKIRQRLGRTAAGRREGGQAARQLDHASRGDLRQHHTLPHAADIRMGRHREPRNPRHTRSSPLGRPGDGTGRKLLPPLPVVTRHDAGSPDSADGGGKRRLKPPCSPADSANAGREGYQVGLQSVKATMICTQRFESGRRGVKPGRPSV
jgi:hypothetical protein